MTENLGARIRYLREWRKLSYAALGYSRAQVSRLETGRVSPSIGGLERIGEALHVSLAALLGTEKQFADALASEEDAFTTEVRSFLPRLNAEQRVYILKVLEAAPKIETRQRYGRTSPAT